MAVSLQTAVIQYKFKPVAKAAWCFVASEIKKKLKLDKRPDPSLLKNWLFESCSLKLIKFDTREVEEFMNVALASFNLTDVFIGKFVVLTFSD